MQNCRPFPQCDLQEKPGNHPKFDPFYKVKIAPKLEKSSDHNHNLVSSEGGQEVRIQQHVKFQAIPSMCSPDNARKPQILPISLSQNSAKIRKITRS